MAHSNMMWLLRNQVLMGCLVGIYALGDVDNKTIRRSPDGNQMGARGRGLDI